LALTGRLATSCDPMNVSSHCPICLASAVSVVRLPVGIVVATCAGCGLLYQPHRPSHAELARLYSEVSYCAWGLDVDETIVQRMKAATFNTYLAVVEKYIGRGQLLDLGCGTGFLLECALARGWDARGVELAPVAAQACRRRVGESRVFEGALEAAPYSAARFAAVTMFDYLEHVPDPRSTLTQVAALLRPGGIVALTTPYVGALSHRLMGLRWSQFKAEHLQYFSPRSLTQALVRTGFVPLKLAPAVKSLNLDYIARHMELYPHSLLTPVSALARRLSGRRLARRNFPIRTGDLFALARCEA